MVGWLVLWFIDWLAGVAKCHLVVIIITGKIVQFWSKFGKIVQFWSKFGKII